MATDMASKIIAVSTVVASFAKIITHAENEMY